MSMYAIILHTASGARVSSLMPLEVVHERIGEYCAVLQRGERLEVVPGPRDPRALEVVEGSPSWWRIPA